MKKALMAAVAALTAVASVGVTTAQAQEPFLGEIRFFGGNFAPRGWALWQGQLLPIAQNQALFSILGTIYGGDGRTTFALPDARGRALVHAGQGPGLSDRRLGSKFGSETTTLTSANMPNHTHTVVADATMHANRGDARSDTPLNKVMAKTPDGQLLYRAGATNITMSSQSVTVDATALPTGGSQSFTNVQPSVATNCIIALQGIFPSRS